METSFISNNEPQKSVTELQKEEHQNVHRGKENEMMDGSKNVAERLSNIERRLAELEITITNNFEHIIKHIQRRE